MEEEFRGKGMYTCDLWRFRKRSSRPRKVGVVTSGVTLAFLKTALSRCEYALLEDNSTCLMLLFLLLMLNISVEIALI